MFIFTVKIGPLPPFEMGALNLQDLKMADQKGTEKSRAGK